MLRLAEGDLIALKKDRKKKLNLPLEVAVRWVQPR